MFKKKWYATVEVKTESTLRNIFTLFGPSTDAFQLGPFETEREAKAGGEAATKRGIWAKNNRYPASRVWEITVTRSRSGGDFAPASLGDG